MRKSCRRILLPALLSCTVMACPAIAAMDSRTEKPVMRTEQELEKELRILLRTFSFNILNLESGFSISRGNHRAKFTRVKGLPNDQRHYMVSGPRLNGILELSIGNACFEGVFFMEIPPGSGPSGRMARIERVPLR